MGSHSKAITASGVLLGILTKRLRRFLLLDRKPTLSHSRTLILILDIMPLRSLHYEMKARNGASCLRDYSEMRLPNLRWKDQFRDRVTVTSSRLRRQLISELKQQVCETKANLSPGEIELFTAPKCRQRRSRGLIGYERWIQIHQDDSKRGSFGYSMRSISAWTNRLRLCRLGWTSSCDYWRE